jgi:hypothetical protein
MSIAANLAALQARHAGISGVVSAPTAYPTGLNAADLPCIITDVLKGKTDWETHGGDLALEVRAYRVRCFCLAGGLGVGFDQGKQQAIAVLDGVLASYRASPTLTSSAAIRIEAGVEDTGVRSDMKYTDPDTSYYGFELLVSVEERWEEDE